ncbi:hypothetical protein HNR26_003782 [Rhizobium rosettiformans]|uniref:Uncharacterized protein n=2 Tax=Rhizobium rosettiformans TaxID=1368430 RepID=A0A4S8PXX4_9HYPH|nr:hypothetical protein [Rhizobium rosettiformans]MBB5277701.1 hypothetical protein [Rhizobium rosettiformans]THV33089.1 hypothetical protein FAA86_18010 [Rhizobium rosettiformans W3]
MTNTPTVTLDDIAAQVRDLSRLLAVIRDDVFEMDYGPKSEGTRKAMIDRVQSLTTIACDTAERTADQIEANYHTIRQPPVLVHPIPDEVLHIGAEILALNERLNRRKEELGRPQ